jgi:hypothetical protein
VPAMMVLVLAVVLTPLLPLVVLAVRVFEVLVVQAVTAEIQLAVVAVMLNVTKPLLAKVKSNRPVPQPKID